MQAASSYELLPMPVLFTFTLIYTLILHPIPARWKPHLGVGHPRRARSVQDHIPLLPLCCSIHPLGPHLVDTRLDLNYWIYLPGIGEERSRNGILRCCCQNLWDFRVIFLLLENRSWNLRRQSARSKMSEAPSSQLLACDDPSHVG